MNDMAFVIAKDLNFNVVGILDEFFDVDPGIAERLLRLGARRVIAFNERNIIMRHPHSAPRHHPQRL